MSSASVGIFASLGSLVQMTQEAVAKLKNRGQWNSAAFCLLVFDDAEA